MNVSRTLFGWSPPHMQPLTPVSEVSEPPESPYPHLYGGLDAGEPIEEGEEVEEGDIPHLPAIPFFKLFSHADAFDLGLMTLGSVAAAVHGAALPAYLYNLGKIINLLALYQQQLSLNSQHQLSPSSHHILANELCKRALYTLCIAASVFVAGWIEVACWLYTGERQTAVIRSRGVQVLLKQNLEYFDNIAGDGIVVSQVSNDVLAVHRAISEKVGNYIHNMATCIGGIAMGFISCWQISLLMLGTGPFIVAAGMVSNLFLSRFAEHVQESYSQAARIAEQAILYVRTVYAFANETIVKYAFANALQSTLRSGIQISLVQGLGLGFVYGIAICSCALGLWVGRFLITHHTANGGQIVIAIFAIILSGLGLNQAATNFQAFEQGRIAAYRLFQVVNRKSPSTNSGAIGGNTLTDVHGNIELRNVYFSYPSCPDVPILSGLYLTLPARKTLALAGSNGSGKSSVIALIERFYDPTLGEVLLDGENIRNLRVEWLRDQIGLVSQEPALFGGSVLENILYGREATMDEVEEAAKIAHAHTFISSLPNGYESKVGDSRLLFSEERKLKIAIARAVLKNPRILLLDEATGSLDVEAARRVQEALDILMLGRSTIVIAHRLTSVRNADTIAVLEEGRLVEMGTHDELMRMDGAYADLIRLQETAKPPRRAPPRMFVYPPPQESVSPSYSKPPSPKMIKSPSLKRQNAGRGLSNFELLNDSPPLLTSPPAVQNPPLNGGGLEMQDMKSEMRVKRQDSFEKAYLDSLPQIDIHRQRQLSNSDISDPESPVSPFLTSDPLHERSHSKSFRRSFSQIVEIHQQADEEKIVTPSLWRLAKLSAPEWFCALLGSFGAALFGSFSPLFAFLLALVAEVYYSPDARAMRREVDKYCLRVAAMGLATVAVNFLQHFYFGILGEKMTERVRRLMFSAILRNEVGWFDKEENCAELLSIRLANDATYVRAAFSNRLSIIIQDITALMVALSLALIMQWHLGLVALITIPLLAFASMMQHLWNTGFSGDMREAHKSARLVLEEAVANMHTVMSFSGGLKVLDLYRQELKKPLRRSLRRGQLCGCAFGASQFALFGCNALLLWYGSVVLRKQPHASFPNFLRAFLVLTFTAFTLVEAFGLGPLVVKRRKLVTPVFTIIDRQSQMEAEEEGLQPPYVAGQIEFQNVDFRYPTQPDISIFVNLSLKVEAGQTVAVVGSTGSGKSTVLALLERFYKPEKGRILIDGRDVKTLNLQWLRNHIGLVQQEPVLFLSSIRDNIVYGRLNATEAEITEASRIANAHHFISSLPHGYDTHIGMSGLQLSIGQRLRIAIARAVLKNAPILLLDEPSTALEAESNRVVQESVEQLIMGNRTTVVVTHKLQLLRRVDMVAVLHDGQIVEEGSHDELMNKCGPYARLMQPQFARSFRQRQSQ